MIKTPLKLFMASFQCPLGSPIILKFIRQTLVVFTAQERVKNLQKLIPNGNSCCYDGNGERTKLILGILNLIKKSKQRKCKQKRSPLEKTTISYFLQSPILFVISMNLNYLYNRRCCDQTPPRQRPTDPKTVCHFDPLLMEIDVSYRAFRQEPIQLLK